VTEDTSSTLTMVGALMGGASGLGALTVALVKWLGGRVVQTEDDANKVRDTRLATIESKLSNVDSVMVRQSERIDMLGRDMGRVEQDHARTLGRVDSLQADWRAKFDKLQDELRARDERIVERIIEVKGDNAKGVEELRGVFETYRVTMHERFTEITRLIVDSNELQLEAARILREHKKGT